MEAIEMEACLKKQKKLRQQLSLPENKKEDEKICIGYINMLYKLFK
tara:strand:- start:205 stop:342 length:138 start_codon:yes stop_codon:yes gene_type:complete